MKQFKTEEGHIVWNITTFNWQLRYIIIYIWAIFMAMLGYLTQPEGNMDVI